MGDLQVGEGEQEYIMCGKVLQEGEHHNIVAVAQSRKREDRRRSPGRTEHGAPFLSRLVLRAKEYAAHFFQQQLFFSTALIPFLLPMPALESGVILSTVEGIGSCH